MQPCPRTDDVWLYWMVRRNSRFEIHSGTQRGLVNWLGSQKVSLWSRNRIANDTQISAMVKAYGLP